jgi:hypothetical protein
LQTEGLESSSLEVLGCWVGSQFCGTLLQSFSIFLLFGAEPKQTRLFLRVFIVQQSYTEEHGAQHE